MRPDIAALVERLRYESQWACVSMSYKSLTTGGNLTHGGLLKAAADEIERLAAECEQLRDREKRILGG